QLQTFALDGARQRCRDIEIECVAEFVLLGGATRLDAGGEVARVVSAKTGFAQRSQQIAQGAESEEVETFIGDLEFCLRLVLADLPAYTRLFGRIVRLVNGDVVLLFHAIDELLD